MTTTTKHRARTDRGSLKPTRKVAAAFKTSHGLFATSVAAVIGVKPDDPLLVLAVSAVLTYGPTIAAFMRSEWADREDRS